MRHIPDQLQRRIWNEKRALRNVTRAGAPITSKGELPFDSDGELRRERITRSHGNREALPLDRVWKAEQIGGGKAISQHLSESSTYES